MTDVSGDDVVQLFPYHDIECRGVLAVWHWQVGSIGWTCNTGHFTALHWTILTARPDMKYMYFMLLSDYSTGVVGNCTGPIHSISVT